MTGMRGKSPRSSEKKTTGGSQKREGARGDSGKGRVPRRDAKSQLRAKGVTFALLAPTIAGLMLGLLFFYGQWRITSPGPATGETIVWLPPGTGTGGMARELKLQGAISDRWMFRVAALMSGERRNLKAGEYAIPPHASIADILTILRDGKSIEHKITIPEGLTSAQAMALVAGDPVLVGPVPKKPAEGTLLPETYAFLRLTTRSQIVARMEKDAREVLAQAWANRAADIVVTTPQEALILASIVEKETRVDSERPRVAAVFMNRLRLGMKLQSDPTTIYALTRGNSALGRPLTRKDLATRSPYNTYAVAGLPPSPICNPGKASIEAVMRPARTKELYFVADGTGGHAFSETLDGHNRNVSSWRALKNGRTSQP